MPVFLHSDRWSDWLTTDRVRETEVDQYLALLDTPDPLAGIEYRPVSSRVNSAVNHGPDLIEPIELGEPETLF